MFACGPGHPKGLQLVRCEVLARYVICYDVTLRYVTLRYVTLRYVMLLGGGSPEI